MHAVAPTPPLIFPFPCVSSPDHNGSDSALQFTGVERISRCSCHCAPRANSVLHRHKVGRGSEEHSCKYRLWEMSLGKSHAVLFLNCRKWIHTTRDYLEIIIFPFCSYAVNMYFLYYQVIFKSGLKFKTWWF